MLPTDPEARFYMILFCVMAVVAVLALVAWYTAGKHADTHRASRREAEKHAVKETARADLAEERLATLRRRHSVKVDDHFDSTLWGGRARPVPAQTLVMTINGTILGDPT